METVHQTKQSILLLHLMSFRPRDPTLMELEPFAQSRVTSDRTLWDFQAAPPFFIQRQRVERPTNSRPQFRSKAVCILDCKHCELEVCRRGMKAILLADMNVTKSNKVELFSTDAPPYSVQLVNDDYRTRNCFCRIRDVACLGW